MPMKPMLTIIAFSVLVLLAASGFVQPAGRETAVAATMEEAAFIPAPMPAGREGALISYGKQIIQQTQKYAGPYVTAAMSCEACHLSAGTKAHGGSLVGAYSDFPQWNSRSKRFIALQDRLAECFLYSMNGRPPAFDSREMIALTAYIAYLSRGSVVGKGVPSQGLIAVNAPHAANVADGKSTYEAKCSACHGANGSGNAAFPPLWGPASFNNGAGMHKAETMAAFVRYNMPFGSAPNTLSAQEAVDVSAFVLSHPRPVFDATRVITFPSQPASFF
jgi:thiosulfate dehydrogenase